MHDAIAQIPGGSVLMLAGLGFVVYGFRRYRRAHTHSTEPLPSGEHWLNFGVLPRSSGSRRRVEYLAGVYAIAGGAFAVLVGLGILATGLGAS